MAEKYGIETDYEFSSKAADEGKEDGEQQQSNPQELLEILQDTANRLQKNAKFEQAVKVLIQALHLEIELYGKESKPVEESATKLIKMCNKLAVKMLKVGKFEMCIGFLSRGLKLTESSFLPNMTPLRIVSLNNASSCYRRLGDMPNALKYAEDALRAGMRAKQEDSLACSHLNICCVHSQNGDHESALRHARDALAAAMQTVRTNGAEDALGSGLSVNDPQRKQKLATLCISYHNTGVELEHLKRYEECMSMYERALQVAEMHLPDNRTMAKSFRQSFNAAKLIAAELNIKVRPQIPEPLMQRPKSATALHRATKSNHSRNTKSAHTLQIKPRSGKKRRPKSASASRQKKRESDAAVESDTRIAFSFPRSTEHDDFTPNALPPVNSASSDGEDTKSVHFKDDAEQKTMLLSEAPAPNPNVGGESRSRREGELERKLAMMQQRVAQLEARLEPVEKRKEDGVADSILFRQQLNELHQRTQDALEAAEVNATLSAKKKKKRRPQSAGLGNRRRRAAASTGSLAAKRLEKAGMVVTGPGITGGHGPNVRRPKRKKKKKPTAVPVDDMATEDVVVDIGAAKEGDEEKKDDEGLEKTVHLMMEPDEPRGPDMEDIGAIMGDGAKTHLMTPTRRSPARSSTSPGQKSSSPGRRKKYDKTPQKLTGQELVKFLAGNTISDYSLKTYLAAHHSAATVQNNQGKTPLQALCGNQRATKEMVFSYINAHPEHVTEARSVSDEGRTALHYLAANKHQGTVDVAKALLNENNSALNLVDAQGRTPLICSFEQNMHKPVEKSSKLFKYLLKKSSMAPPDDEFGNNQLHIVLWCLARTTISAETAHSLVSDLIALNPSLVLQTNRVGVSPAGMAESCFSKKIQKMVKKAVEESVSKELPDDALNLLETLNAQKKKKKKKLKKSKSKLRVNPFRDPPPNYDTMPQHEKEAKRVFYLLHEILEARHERPIIMFYRLDEDKSGTVTKEELRKGLSGLEPPIKISRRQASCIFKMLDTDGGGDLSYREIAREIKKVSRYKKPPAATEEELAMQKQEIAEDKEARRLERLAKRKKKKTGPFLLTDEQGNFLVSRVFSKMFLTIEKKQMKIIDFFREIDQDESGIISGKELRKGLKEVLKINLTNEQYHQVMSKIDEDHSDEIDYSELAHVIKQANPRREASKARRDKRMKSQQNKSVPKKKKKKKTLAQLKKKSVLAGVFDEAGSVSKHAISIDNKSSNEMGDATASVLGVVNEE